MLPELIIMRSEVHNNLSLVFLVKDVVKEMYGDILNFLTSERLSKACLIKNN